MGRDRLTACWICFLARPRDALSRAGGPSLRAVAETHRADHFERTLNAGVLRKVRSLLRYESDHVKIW